MNALDSLFSRTRQENRAALVGYLPAGYPTVAESKDLFAAMIDGGVDLLEIGVPYSDPVMDGPTIQAAVETALEGGFRVKHLFEVVESVTARGGHAVVMTYWNLVHRYGVDAFARDLASAGGLGIVTPDLIPDEADEWLTASSNHNLDCIFLVAPSSSEERIERVARASSGFIYAAAVMGVTGAREAVDSETKALVTRVKGHTDLPVGVGLGVHTGAQAAEIAAYADAVIVGSELVSRCKQGPAAVTALAEELAQGVRKTIAPA